MGGGRSRHLQTKNCGNDLEEKVRPLLSDADASRDEVVIYDEGDGGKLATTKAAVTIKAEQQSVTKSGKWHRPNKFGQLFFKIMNPRES